MSERWQVIWQAIRAGVGLGPRRKITTEAQARRIVDKAFDIVDKAVDPAEAVRLLRDDPAEYFRRYH